MDTLLANPSIIQEYEVPGGYMSEHYEDIERTTDPARYQSLLRNLSEKDRARVKERKLPRSSQ